MKVSVNNQTYHLPPPQILSIAISRKAVSCLSLVRLVQLATDYRDTVRRVLDILIKSDGRLGERRMSPPIRDPE